MIRPCTAGRAPGGLASRAAIEAARHGAARVLRVSTGEDVEEAVASALARLVVRAGQLGAIERPEAFAAVCGRNAAVDQRRGLRRDRMRRARLMAASCALPPAEAICLPPGWLPQEVGLQARAAVNAMHVELQRAPSVALQIAATSLSLLLAGLPLPAHRDDGERRRFDRGVAQLAQLMRDRG